MWRDIRHSAQGLLRTPVFAAAAVVILALGIGLNTALFSVVNSIFLKPPSVHAPQELAYLYWINGTVNRRPFVMPVPDYEFFVTHNEAFEAVTAHWGVLSRLTVDGDTQMASGETVRANYFDVVGVKPALGRALRLEEDDIATPDLAVVISHDLWTRRFHGRADVIGKPLRMNSYSAGEKEFTIVGVMGPEFHGLSDPWRPSQFWVTFAQAMGPQHARAALGPIARLKPGVTMREAQAIVATQGTQIRRALRYRDNAEYVALAVNDTRMPFDPQASLIFLRLAAAMTVVVTTVLLVAAVNAAGMTLARGVGRAGELAVRRALGATGWRIVRQLLTESVLLSVVAGAGGILVARWVLDLFRFYTPAQFAVDVTMDAGALLFALLTGAGVGLVIGMVPAWRASATDLVSALPGSAVPVARRARVRLRHFVMIPQVALSLMWLLVAGMQGRALMSLERASIGYRTDHLLAVGFELRDASGDRGRTPNEERQAERTRNMYTQLLARLTAGSAAEAALTSALPLRRAESELHRGSARRCRCRRYRASGDVTGRGVARLLPRQWRRAGCGPGSQGRRGRGGSAGGGP